MMQCPIEELALDLQCIVEAKQRNNLELLDKLFDGAVLTLPQPAELSHYYLRYALDELPIDVNDLTKMLAQFEGNVLDEQGALQVNIAMHYPPELLEPTARMLALEFERCFELTFTRNGDLQPWLAQWILQDELQQLYQQFGEVAVKFKLFECMVKLYLPMLSSECTPADKQTSGAFSQLMQAQIKAYQQMAQLVARLQQGAMALEPSYKAKNEAQQLALLIKTLFFRRQLPVCHNIRLLLQALVELIDNPLKMDNIEQICSYASQIDIATANDYGAQLLGALSVFVGALLTTFGLIGLSANPVMLSGSLIAAGVGFFGGGSHLFYSGLSQSMREAVNQLTDKVTQMELAYQASYSQHTS